MLHHSCRKRGVGCVSAPPKVLIWWKFGKKSRGNLGKSVQTFTKSLKIWANSRKYEQEWRPTAPKITWRAFFWRSLFMEFFSGTFGRIRAKILRTPKKLPAPSPMCCTTTDLEIFWYSSRDFLSCIGCGEL